MFYLFFYMLPYFALSLTNMAVRLKKLSSKIISSQMGFIFLETKGNHHRDKKLFNFLDHELGIRHQKVTSTGMIKLRFRIL